MTPTLKEHEVLDLQAKVEDLEMTIQELPQAPAVEPALGLAGAVSRAR